MKRKVAVLPLDLLYNPVSPKRIFSEYKEKDAETFQAICERQALFVFADVLTLTGLTDCELAEDISACVFRSLWMARVDGSLYVSPEDLLHTIVVGEVYKFLRDTDNIERIAFIEANQIGRASCRERV